MSAISIILLIRKGFAYPVVDLLKCVVIDVWVRGSMKSATKCIMQCDLYDAGNLQSH